MPLTRAPGLVSIDLNKVMFPMSDIDRGLTVVCRVYEDALRKLAGGGSSIVSLQEMFENHRELVEGLASRKYDLGQASSRIETSDV
jgi:hypothetical protein